MQAREQYEAEQKAKAAQEAKEDVTKRGSFHHFHANLLCAPRSRRDRAEIAPRPRRDRASLCGMIEKNAIHT